MMFILVPLLAALLVSASPAGAGRPRYIVFLHNRFLEDHGERDTHPSYGRAEYREILARFRKDGFIVISQKRPPNTDEAKYATKVISELDSLFRLGVRPDEITVVGTSKGGYIAQFVSSMSRTPRLNFVFIGSSFKEERKEEAELQLNGRILSITEASDTGSIRLSMQPRFKRSHITSFHEIVVHTGLHHGFLFKSLDAWIVPAERWARYLPLP